MDLAALLQELVSVPGVSGLEDKVARVAMDALRPYVDELYKTPMGAVVGTIKGHGPALVLDAHLDQIGLVITAYGGNGFLRFDKCGGVDPRTLSGMEVIIHGEEDLFGVVSSIPPHLAKKEDAGKAKDFRELAIDTGLSDEELKRKVKLGDRVSLKAYPAQLLNGLVSGAAMDDRAGIAALIRTAELLRDAECDRTVSFQFTVREEVGGRAAAATAYNINAHAAIAVDVSFARTPGIDHRDAALIDKGPMIGYSPILDKGLFDRMKQIAEEKGIPYQLEIMHRGTGTHADELTNLKAGLPVGLVSIPLRYMHTTVETVSLEDIENTARLLAVTVLAGPPEGEGGVA
ncbi:MAG: M20/M25/M40 family metallo-hydrolase [Clostridia bacterium]|nr:M20/M25/M40 family metallo-hydrolase [Clostridia bacterium]